MSMGSPLISVNDPEAGREGRRRVKVRFYKKISGKLGINRIMLLMNRLREVISKTALVRGSVVSTSLKNQKHEGFPMCWEVNILI